jgi:hypothetical protein
VWVSGWVSGWNGWQGQPFVSSNVENPTQDHTEVVRESTFLKVKDVSCKCTSLGEVSIVGRPSRSYHRHERSEVNVALVWSERERIHKLNILYHHEAHVTHM